MEGTAVGDSQLEVGMQLVADGQGMLEEGMVVGVGQRVVAAGNGTSKYIGRWSILWLVVKTLSMQDWLPELQSGCHDIDSC